MPKLEDVYEEIQEDPFWDHLRLPGIKFVPGFGATRPKVLLVGEAPGAQENARLRPFCGPSGRVLDQMLEVAGLRLEDKQRSNDPEDWANAYVTNVVKYRPPGNRTPTLPEIFHAREGFKREEPRLWAATSMEGHERNRKLAERYESVSLPPGAGSLRREWAALGKPRVIVCVGGVAHTALHPVNWEGVSAWAGKPVHSRTGGVASVWFWSMYHPAYGLRRQNMQPVMERHWEELGAWLEQGDVL